MYVNIGGDVIIDSCKIIGIFDIDKTTVYKVNRNYLSNSEKRGKIINVTQKIPKSFIVCEKDPENVVYISPLTPVTLSKRLSQSGANLFGGV